MSIDYQQETNTEMVKSLSVSLTDFDETLFAPIRRAKIDQVQNIETNQIGCMSQSLLLMYQSTASNLLNLASVPIIDGTDSVKYDEAIDITLGTQASIINLITKTPANRLSHIKCKLTILITELEVTLENQAPAICDLANAILRDINLLIEREG